MTIFLLYLQSNRFKEGERDMLDQTTMDFIILLLVLGVVAFAIAMISYAIKQRRRRRMIDPIDHHHKRK